ncbi:MAG: type I 3-dehydroquinate dehydratase [Clostridia bacterium]|nr:type I 3-dehydroquinate dehydratase [Clostridia bacterium]
MKDVKFSESGKPIIIGVVKEATADAAISTIKNCETEGATAFDLHVSLLEGKERDSESLERIFRECDSPILAVHYNNLPKGITTKNTSEERMAELVRAVEVGAAGIDMQGYTFCKSPLATLEGKDAKKYPFITANPKEVVLDDAIITKQRQIIDKVHSLGGEVLMSTHTGVYLNTEQIVALALEIEKREVDIIKLVTPVNTKEEVVEALGSVIELKKNIKNAKVHFHCSGKLGRITRYIAPYFGASIVFATDHYNERADKEQLLIKKFHEFYNEIKTED